ncbi:hypothetical protein [Fusobacterium sp.]|uniref:hypothetical protein n=1 Tax=Fusobacterium sp. TaxID=68766 RepID=UPI00396CBA39
MFRKYKKIIVTVLFVLGSVASYAFRLDNIVFNERMDGDNGGYRESYLVNEGLNKVRYKISVLPSEKRDGSKYVEVFPKVITVDPQSVGTVKIYAKAPGNIEKGEYNFKLQFKPVAIPVVAEKKDGKLSGNSNMAISPVIEMKGYVGEVDFSKVIRFEDIKVGKNPKGKGITVSGKLSNDSFAGIEFGAEAYGSNEFFFGSAYVDDLGANIQNKSITLLFKNIKKPGELKKIVFYRTPSNNRKVVKEIQIK